MVEAADATFAFLALVAGAVVVIVAAKRAPRERIVSSREHARPLAEGPLRQTIVAAEDTRVLAERAAQVGRGLLEDALLERGLTADKARLPPILLHLASGGAPSSWWRIEARSRYRGPAALFWPWYALRSVTESDEARSLRYIDTLGKELDAWVRHRSA